MSLMAHYAKLTEFLSYVCGNSYEIVLHDIADPDSSIIDIKNGGISGRSIGGPMSDLALKMLNGKYYLENDYLVNRGTTRDGKVLASSTFFIKNPDGQLLGMLCINHDLTEIFGYSNKLLGDLSSFGLSTSAIGQADDIHEHFESNVEDLMSSIYKRAIRTMDISPERMNPEEKMQFVGTLENQGYFLLKGGVSEVAKLLKVSEATIYRYLNKNSK